MIYSPSKHIPLDKLKGIRNNNYMGAYRGKTREYCVFEVEARINELESIYAAKLCATANKREFEQAVIETGLPFRIARFLTCHDIIQELKSTILEVELMLRR
jgi:hypothetical protein